MARVNINSIVYEALAEKYSSKFDSSAQDLYNALKKANQNGEIIGDGIINVISEKTIRNFFDANNQNKVLESTLNTLCKFLLNGDSYIEAVNKLCPKKPAIGEKPSIQKSPYQVDLVRLQKYAQVVDRDCQIRILDMRKPRKIEDVYVEVRLLDTPMRYRQRKVEELFSSDENSEQEVDPVVDTDNSQVSGLEYIFQCRRLMILGRPGAGKTSFLKEVATITLADLLASGCLSTNPLPIYLSLKDVSEAKNQETLVDAIQEKTNFPEIITLLEEGYCLILLDALDEVIMSEVQRVYGVIERFLEKYPKNRCVITCRNAAREYFFQGFILVEVAPFGLKQIEQFVNRWFQEEPATASRFLAEIKTHKPVERLARTPLLLTFLCLTFDEKYSLSSDPYGLYSDIIDVCSRLWDASRRIKREMPYADGLTQERLLDMLSQIAYDTFTKAQSKKRSQYSWKRWELEEEIGTFTQLIFGFEAENRSISSRQVLEAIEVNTGIIIQEVRDTYIFAHLTFREYFTARYIALSGDPELVKQIVTQYLINRQWREIFRIIPGRLRSADEFLMDIFWEINKIGKTEKIQLLLQRIDSATQRHGVASCGWRAMYLALVRNTYYIAEHGLQINYPWAIRLATKLRDINKRRKQIVLPTPWSQVTTELLLIYKLGYQQIPETIGKIQYHPSEIETPTFFNQRIPNCLEKAIEQSQYISKELVQELNILKDRLPSSEIKNQDWERLLKNMEAKDKYLISTDTRNKDWEEWSTIPQNRDQGDISTDTQNKDWEEWSTIPQNRVQENTLTFPRNQDGQEILTSLENKYWKAWLNELLRIMHKFLDVGRIFDFSKEDSLSMNNYLYACNLLVDCISGDSMTSPRLRNLLIDSLLLPQEKISTELLEQF